MICLNRLLLVTLASCLGFSQQTINFELSADSQSLTTQIPGVIFGNAVALHAGSSLNDVSFPVKSGTVAAVDRGGPMSIEFSRPAASFSAFLTHRKRVTISAFDAGGKLLRSVNSPSERNFSGSLEPDTAPNEFLEIRADRIAKVLVAADPAGSSLVIDDITFSDYVERPTFNVSPERISFDHSLTLPAPPPEPIIIDAEPGTSYTSESTARWVRVSPASGPTSARVFLVLDTTQLPAPGIYAATVTFRSGDASRTVAVNLRLAGAPILYGTPSALTFSISKGGPLPSAQAILVGSKNANQPFSVAPSASWLAVTQTGGSTPANVFVTVAPGDLPAGTYTAEIGLNPNNATERVGIPVKLEIRPSAAVMEVRDVVNAGSRLAGPVAPGSLVEIRGSNFSRVVEQATAVPFPVSLAAMSVLLNGTAIPLHSVGPDRVIAQLPFDLPSGSHTMRLRSGSFDFSEVAFTVASSAPGIVLQGDRAAAINQDGTVNSRQANAAPGSIVSVFLTGQGQVTPPVSAGVAAPPAPLSRPVLPVTATVGEISAVVRDAVLAPGQPGVLQVNLSIPELSPGEYLLRITVGANTSNAAILSVGSR